jgi:hypothetical protein
MFYYLVTNTGWILNGCMGIRKKLGDEKLNRKGTKF